MKIVMRRIVLLFAISASLSLCAQNKESESTSAPEGRYEIVQSPILRSCTFKLDKYTGDIWQLVKAEDGSSVWQKMERISAFPDTKNVNQINYQLFMGSSVAADTYLINVNTGTTWVLVEDKKKFRFWEPMKQI